MKTTATYQESYRPKQGFGARLLFCALLLSFIGLSKVFAQAPVNDACGSAINITSSVICNSISGLTLNATPSITGTCAGNDDDDVWYSFTAVAADHDVVVQGGSNFDAVIDVRSGACGGTVNISCIDQTGIGSTEYLNLSNLTIGNTYFIRVYDYGSGSGSGDFQICVTHNIPVPVATAASNTTCTSFSANWNPVSGSTAFYLDVSTDTAFTTFVSGFNNLNVGNVTTYNVAGLSSPSPHYYRVRMQNINGTSLNSNTITVIPGDDASFVYTLPTYCQTSANQTPVITGLPGGTFSSTPAGLVINPSTGTIDMSGSTLGVYTVTYTTNGSCPNSSSVSITISSTCISLTFTSPLNGATINNRCELEFCIYDSIGQNQGVQIVDTALNALAYIYNGQGGSYCVPLSSYATAIPAGNQTFYLSSGGYIYDTITVNIASPIVPLQNELTYTQTPTTNGGYDFTVSGFSPSETYTMVLNNYYNNQYDTVFVSNATTATISHQFPHNGDFFGDIYVTADCDGSMSHDSMFVSVNNSACSSFIDLNYGSIYTGSNCGSDSVDLYGTVFYGNLSANDSSQVIINWGDGNTETMQILHVGNTSGNFVLSYSHEYNAPGAYTAIVTVFDANACSVDTLIQSVTIGSTTCGSLTGTVYSDVNTNCSLDNGTDIGLANIWVTATDNNSNVFYAWADYNGNYAFNSLPNGTYVVDLAYLNSGYSVTCSGAFPQTVTINNNLLVENCAVTCSGTFDAAITGISLWNGFFPGQADGLLPHVGIMNAGCNSTSVSGQVKIVLDACIQYTGPSTYSNAGAPDAIITASTGDTLVWNVSNINNIGTFSYYDYAINTLTCTSAQVGDSACITMIISPTNGDADPSNNTFTRCFEIGVSYDPNNKEVMPEGVGAQGFIPADEPSLTYTINFQNTGTAPAWNVYVMDTIDTDLDINSIEILSVSHRMQVYTLPNRAMKFMFADIMLPDSTHDEAHSHGYVTFKIKLNPGLTPGTEMENTGHIYFDYNEPVVTNTTLNTIEFPSSVEAIGKSALVRVYPNPAKESVTVLSNSNAAGLITVTDVLGKIVREIKTNSEKTVINTADLQSGVYFIKLAQGDISKTEKIMITK